jgi:diphosphomevalonate decarboxylase
MEHTVATSPFYLQWPALLAQDISVLKNAITEQDFVRLGEISEGNAMAMHALMLSARPPVLYAQPNTVAAMHQIWKVRSEGLKLYFTQDAGYNLKLLFLDEDSAEVLRIFPNLEIFAPFANEAIDA